MIEFLNRENKVLKGLASWNVRVLGGRRRRGEGVRVEVMGGGENRSDGRKGDSKFSEFGHVLLGDGDAERFFVVVIKVAGVAFVL